MRKIKETKAKEPIKVRYKKLANGNQSIYLDYYKDGKREYDFLKLYLVPETTPIAKNQNAEMLQLANTIKSQKVVELQNSAHGFKFSNIKQKARLIDYLQAIADERKQKAGGAAKGQWQVYNILIKHLKQYKGEHTTFKQVNKEYCSGFASYLNTVKNKVYRQGFSDVFTSGLLSENTKYGYIKTLNVALNKATMEGILSSNPLSQLPRQERPKRQLDNREYLTVEEVKMLVATPCRKPIVKQAFLFSCFSGLRFGDVKNLSWNKLQRDNDGKTVIRYTQQKTGKPENLQLSEEALKFLPDKADAEPTDKIFPLSNNGYTNETLKSWILAAGITKRVTFHVGRHTNATLLLSLGVPIETVSKLLGHADIQTTQIYAKVIDKNKRDAVDMLNGLTD
ncbi:tyrosine recombinase [Bacteroidia bacterium]|nr:tyrosine recombinase [Bacteroidia bacterium]